MEGPLVAPTILPGTFVLQRYVVAALAAMFGGVPHRLGVSVTLKGGLAVTTTLFIEKVHPGGTELSVSWIVYVPWLRGMGKLAVGEEPVVV